MNRQQGFTLVEIAVVVPIMMVILIGLFTLLTYLLQSSASEQMGAQNLYDEHIALGIIESDASLSASFIPRIDSSVSDPAQNGTWSFVGDSSTVRTLILRSYATTLNPLDNNRRAVFLSSKGCTTDALYFNTPLTYNTIYFVKDQTLYRRRLVNTTTATCDPPYQKQSCPSAATAPASWGCRADDEILARGVTSFTVDYYSTSDDDTVVDTYTNPNGDQEVTAADSARVTVQITRRAYGQPQTNATSLRISKLITGQSDTN